MSTGETAPEMGQMILSEAELSACVYMCGEGKDLYVLKIWQRTLKVSRSFLSSFCHSQIKGKSLTRQDRRKIEWMDGEIGGIEDLLEGFI